ncbi:MAG: SsrA-binding protein SmpB [Erysipelotrichaceae bacterium]
MSNKKIITLNRKASHDYFLEEHFEAGISLLGTEIKSLRKGSCQLKDAYISFVDNEAFIKEMFIPKYEFGNQFNHDETRIRKLLLHKSEIKKLQQQVKIKGYTIVPVSIYLTKGIVKLDIALAKGKDLHDKRNVEREKTAKREIEKALKQRY